MPTCLITGGAGFIGSHIAEHLVGLRWTVRVLDNLSTGKRGNLAGFADRLTFLEGDVRDSNCLADAVRGVEIVFHEAAMVSVPKSIEQPVECHEICATGTLRVLEACRAAGVRRLVYAASASAYGDKAPVPVREDGPLYAQSPYAAAKLAGEHYCSAFSSFSDLETVRLRYFNVFGPRQDPTSPYSGVISIFCSKLLAGAAPTAFGDGLQSRDFVYVANVVRANYLAATVPNLGGKVFNVGAGGRTSLIELAASLNRAIGTNLSLNFGPPRAGDIRHSQADISAIRSELGYEPTVGLDEGLQRTIDFYRA